MTVFQHFRFWLRQAPIAERLSAAVGAALFVAVVAWLLVPASPKSQTTNIGLGPSSNQAGVGSGSVTTQPGGANASGAGTVSGVATGSGSGTGSSTGTGASAQAQSGVASGSAAGGGGGGGSASSTGGGCASPPGSDQGVTKSQFNIAVILINLVGPSANQAVGVPTPQEQQQDFEQVVAATNDSGGVACRKLVVTYYTPNIADQNSLQQTCLQIVQSKVFAVIDLGAFSFFPALASCIPQNQLPLFSGLGLPQTTQTEFYPYYFSLQGIENVLHHNAIFGLSQLGFFSKAQGFTKLGLAYRDCTPVFYSEATDWLHQVGLSSSQIVPFDTGCPSTAVTPPNVDEQAILTFQENHVSNVMFIDDVSAFEAWTPIAEQQGFKPKYGFPDDGEMAISSGSSANWQNLNGAIAVENGSYGENTTPGLSPSPGTVKCNGIYAKNGAPPVYQRHDDGISGVACDDVFFFQAAAEHAPVLERAALAAGLNAAKTYTYSYPQGPADFTGYHVTGGGEFWRPAEAYTSCTCWRMLEPNFQPSFS